MNKVLLKAFHIAIFIFLATSTVIYTQSKAIAPRFDISDCAIPVPPLEKVVCGYLTVPENREKKTGKTIRLPIIILKSDSPRPKPDPVLRTLGGPGVSSLKMVTGRRYSPWLKDRDMIIFEQRGTKYSQPSLQCAEVDEAAIKAAKTRQNEAMTKKGQLAAARLCNERLVKEGIDLAAYNSTASAADIEDLRRLLKLEKINLYGLSYSARLMLNVMRDYPAGIRSVILESAMPLEINYDEVGVDGIARVFSEFFAGCRADADCAAAFPKLEDDLYALVKKANAIPFNVSVKAPASGQPIELVINGNDIVTWLADYIFSSNGRDISAAPLQIYQVINGDYTPLKNYAASKLEGSSYSLGMRYSVWCREEAPFENMKKVRAQSTAYPWLKGYEVQILPDVCRVWNIPPAKKIENLPVKSDIPTMIVDAQYDAYTPPAWGKRTSKNLKNSFFVEIPWAGHGPAFNSPPCVSEMIAKFIDDPAARPASDCVDKIRKYFKFKSKDPG
jgi:pimeloyl-ACP methyl ester carboxylesterase